MCHPRLIRQPSWNTITALFLYRRKVNREELNPVCDKTLFLSYIMFCNDFYVTSMADWTLMLHVNYLNVYKNMNYKSVVNTATTVMLRIVQLRIVFEIPVLWFS